MDKRLTKSPSGQLVFDTAFPPNKDSLFGKQEPMPEFRVWEHYRWISPKPFYGGVPYNLHTSVTPSKIRLGTEPACPLLAAMAALALKPVRIQNMISQLDHNEVFFKVRLFRDGDLSAVKVDHFFPHNPVTKDLVFLSSEGRELWPMLIEKAYAKLSNSYQAMLDPAKGTSLVQAFDVLTGYPTYTIKHRGEAGDAVWKQLQKAYLKYFPMTARSDKTQCTVVELTEFEEKQAVKKCVKLMIWDPELIARCKDLVPIKENDQPANMYLLAFDAYLRRFQETAVNKYKSEFSFTKSLVLELERKLLGSPQVFSANSSPAGTSASAILDTSGVHLIMVEAAHNFSGYLTIYQQSKTNVKCRCGVLLGFRADSESEIEYKDCASYRPQSCITLDLGNKRKGVYYCLLQLDLDTLGDSDYKLVVQGNSGAVVIKQVVERPKIKDVLLELLKAFAMDKGTRAEVIPGVYEYHFMNCLNIWLGKYFVNRTADSTLISTFTVQKGTATFMAPYSGSKAIVRVAPGKTEYFMVRWQKSPEAPVIGYHNYVQKSKDRIMRQIIDGEMQPEQKQEISPGIFFVQFRHDCGMLFGVLNTTKHMLYKGIHRFALKNMVLEDDEPEPDVVRTVVPPANAAYKWAYIEDMFRKAEFTVSHEGEMQTYDKGSESLVREIIKTGSHTKLDCYGAIWTKIIDDHWCMYAKNTSKRNICVCVEIKKAVNLKCTDGERWETALAPGEGSVKRIQSKNPFNVSNCAWHASCKLLSKVS